MHLLEGFGLRATSSARGDIWTRRWSPLDPGKVRNSSGVQYDHRVTVHTILARTLWLTGRPDKALEVARTCVEDAIAIDHDVSLCLTLSTSACPLAFLIGGRAAAQPYLLVLRETAIKNSMIRWQYWADA